MNLQCCVHFCCIGKWFSYICIYMYCWIYIHICVYIHTHTYTHSFIQFIYFNWRLITLQYCGGFGIHWHESAMVVHVFPIPSLSVIPVHQPWAPVSCIEPGLAIYFTYGYIHVSVHLSNHPTLAFSHRVQKFGLYIYVSFAVSHTGSSLPSFLIPYICVNILYCYFSF